MRKLQIVLGMLVASSGFAQEAWTPDAPKIDRYAGLWKRNPFTLTTAPGSTAGFARDFALAGISKIGNEVTVLVINRKTRAYLRLSREANSDDIRVLEILSPENRQSAKVRIAQGTSEAILTYDHAVLAAPAVTAANGNGKGAEPIPEPAPKKKRLSVRLSDPKKKVEEGKADTVRKNRSVPGKWK